MSSAESDFELLLQRARALAMPRSDGALVATGDEVLVFHVRRATYAISTSVVLAVRKLDRIMPVPRGVGLAGLAVVDGEIVAVVRLDSLGPAEAGLSALAVVLGRSKPELSLLVDDVVGIRPASDAERGENEAIVFLDGVALLRARGR